MIIYANAMRTRREYRIGGAKYKLTHRSPPLVVAPSSSVSAAAVERSRAKILLSTIRIDSHLTQTWRNPSFSVLPVLTRVGNSGYEATEKMRNTIERDTTSHHASYPTRRMLVRERPTPHLAFDTPRHSRNTRGRQKLVRNDENASWNAPQRVATSRRPP
jgi:hypothetical protein